MNCACSADKIEKGVNAYDDFARVRKQCRVLNEVLIPEKIWGEYNNFVRGGKDAAHHAPVTFLAYKRGYLNSITRPIHEFGFRKHDNELIFTNQYRNDLTENWFMGYDEWKRRKNCNTFLGRLHELVFAFWLLRQGWSISALEATGACQDIVAEKDNRRVTFEVKYISKDDILFQMNLDALNSNGVSVSSIPVYEPIDYMTFRVYEAAKQLYQTNSHKIAVIILETHTVYYEIPLHESWIDWKEPRFFIKFPFGLQSLFCKEASRNKNWLSEMPEYIRSLDGIIFLDFNEKNQLRKRHYVAVHSSEQIF